MPVVRLLCCRPGLALSCLAQRKAVFAATPLQADGHTHTQCHTATDAVCTRCRAAGQPPGGAAAAWHRAAAQPDTGRRRWPAGTKMTRHAAAITTYALVLLHCMLMILGVPLHAFSLTRFTVLLKMFNF